MFLLSAAGLYGCEVCILQRQGYGDHSFLAFNTVNGCLGSRLFKHVLFPHLSYFVTDSINKYLQIKFASNNHPALPPVISNVLNHWLFIAPYLGHQSGSCCDLMFFLSGFLRGLGRKRNSATINTRIPSGSTRSKNPKLV